MDRFVQEVDVIIRVLKNIQGLTQGQVPVDANDYDTHLDQKGNQDEIDALLASL